MIKTSSQSNAIVIACRRRLSGKDFPQSSQSELRPCEVASTYLLLPSASYSLSHFAFITFIGPLHTLSSTHILLLLPSADRRKCSCRGESSPSQSFFPFQQWPRRFNWSPCSTEWQSVTTDVRLCDVSTALAFINLSLPAVQYTGPTFPSTPTSTIMASRTLKKNPCVYKKISGTMEPREHTSRSSEVKASGMKHSAVVTSIDVLGSTCPASR